LLCVERWRVRNRLLLLLLSLLCLLSISGVAWSEDESPFRVLQLDISVYDKFQRPFQAPPEMVSLGVRLAQGEQQTCKNVFDHEQLSSAGIEYPRKADQFVTFPVENGVAKAQFVIFKDEKVAAVDYELVVYTKEKVDGASEKVAVTPPIWHIGTSSQSGDLTAEKRAPHSKAELAAIAVFGVVGSVAAYVLFGRIYFSRLLFNNRQEVGSAIGWSNILVALSITLVVLCVSVLYFFPYVLWQKPMWIYGVVMGGYAALLAITFGLTGLMTRR
jgi:hypothetical protein